jgi:hypothetical protein
MQTDLVDRLKARIALQENGCWLWTGSMDSCGRYGRLSFGHKYRAAHRLSYELFKGQIPANAVLDHLCRVTRCVNPDHLEPVSQRENILRGIGPSAQHAAALLCKNGHPFTEDNVYYRAKNKKWRKCRLCNREEVKRYREKKKAVSHG